MQGVNGTSQTAPQGVEDGWLLWSIYQITCSFQGKDRWLRKESTLSSRGLFSKEKCKKKKKNSIGFMILLIKVILPLTCNKHTRCLIRSLKIFLYSSVHMNISVDFFFWAISFLLSSETAANIFLCFPQMEILLSHQFCVLHWHLQNDSWFS